MTLRDLIDGVAYEIQGNVVILNNICREQRKVFESASGSGISSADLEDFLDLEIEFLYSKENGNGDPALCIELDGNKGEL